MGVQCGKLIDALGLGSCFSFLQELPPLTLTPKSSPSRKLGEQSVRTCACGICGETVQEFSLGARGVNLCRACIRREDEALLEPLTEEERAGLDGLSRILDRVPWSFWKPGEQPAELLEWLWLGDLEEAMDFGLLARKKITAVVNLINWWELTARLPDIPDLASFYASKAIDFLEADSEDRLFFDIVGKSWPEAEVFLKTCQSNGQRVLVNCKAGHNRSACICICWLVVHEGMNLMDAVEWVLLRRGTILSNHGFRLQLVRLALSVGRLGEVSSSASNPVMQGAFDAEVERAKMAKIIMRKRKSAKYDFNSKEFGKTVKRSISVLIPKRSPTLILDQVSDQVTQRTLKLELVACLYHRGRNFSQEYEFTSDPPTIIGSGFSGDVVLCKRRERTAVRENKETGVRCVKTFDLEKMGPDRLEKLKNEAVIYLSLEHPHIARLFDVYDDENQVSLVMQYCSGGTLEDSLRERGRYSEADFQQVAFPMLSVVNYIHGMGIVHRDIKPRNWVYEADGVTVKLIDFGFSAKGYGGGDGDQGSLMGCMGTLGYLAPEVVKAGLSADTGYNEKCDIWSLGVVFYELLAGQPAFHREKGMCDGYTEEVVLREIEEVTPDGVENLLLDVPESARPFLRRMLERDLALRPSAREALDDPYLTAARTALLHPASALPVETVIERFRAHGRVSKPTRAWLLAVARSPTYLPWSDFCQLRNTFKMFDARGLTGTVNLETFLAVVLDALFPEHESADAQEMEEELRSIWRSVCGNQESLSYCEFLAFLLPPIEDVFEDVGDTPAHGPKGPLMPPIRSSESMSRGVTPGTPENSPKCVSPRGWDEMASAQWDPSAPVSRYLPLLRARQPRRLDKFPVFHESMSVRDVVAAMSKTHMRWVVVRYEGGKQAFFDYMDINHQLVRLCTGTAGSRTSELMARVSGMQVGIVANCSGHSSYVPVSSDTPLREILRLVASNSGAHKVVRRVPIVDSAGEVLHVFTCLDFLDLALQFAGPAAVLKSSGASTFDHRDTILHLSVPYDDAFLAALRIMDTERLTVCPAVSRELSGDLGGVVAVNVVSVADLKWVVSSEQYDILDKSVCDFVHWRSAIAGKNLDQRLRRQRLRRFNVVSVHAGDSLHTLAHRLLVSKLQRIFLSSDDIARIVGVVSSRDILVEVLDQLI